MQTAQVMCALPPPAVMPVSHQERCTCCPYGYHIDVDFLGFLDSLKNNGELRRLRKMHSRRRLERQAIETRMLIEGSRLQVPDEEQQRRSSSDLGSGPTTPTSQSSDDEQAEDGLTSRMLEEIDASIADALTSIDYLMHPPRTDDVFSFDYISPAAGLSTGDVETAHTSSYDNVSSFDQMLTGSLETDNLVVTGKLEMWNLSSYDNVSSADQTPAGRLKIPGSDGGLRESVTSSSVFNSEPCSSVSSPQLGTSHSPEHLTFAESMDLCKTAVIVQNRESSPSHSQLPSPAVSHSGVVPPKPPPRTSSKTKTSQTTQTPDVHRAPPPSLQSDYLDARYARVSSEVSKPVPQRLGAHGTSKMVESGDMEAKKWQDWKLDRIPAKSSAKTYVSQSDSEADVLVKKHYLKSSSPKTADKFDSTYLSSARRHLPPVTAVITEVDGKKVPELQDSCLQKPSVVNVHVASAIVSSSSTPTTPLSCQQIQPANIGRPTTDVVGAVQLTRAHTTRLSAFQHISPESQSTSLEPRQKRSSSTPVSSTPDTTPTSSEKTRSSGHGETVDPQITPHNAFLKLETSSMDNRRLLERLPTCNLPLEAHQNTSRPKIERRLSDSSTCASAPVRLLPERPSSESGSDAGSAVTQRKIKVATVSTIECLRTAPNERTVSQRLPVKPQTDSTSLNAGPKSSSFSGLRTLQSRKAVRRFIEPTPPPMDEQPQNGSFERLEARIEKTSSSLQSSLPAMTRHFSPPPYSPKDYSPSSAVDEKAGGLVQSPSTLKGDTSQTTNVSHFRALRQFSPIQIRSNLSEGTIPVEEICDKKSISTLQVLPANNNATSSPTIHLESSFQNTQLSRPKQTDDSVSSASSKEEDKVSEIVDNDSESLETSSDQLAKAMAFLMTDAGCGRECPDTPPAIGLNPDSLITIRQYIASSLQQMRLLEQQSKSIPVLQMRISVLKEE